MLALGMSISLALMTVSHQQYSYFTLWVFNFFHFSSGDRCTFLSADILHDFPKFNPRLA